MAATKLLRRKLSCNVNSESTCRLHSTNWNQTGKRIFFEVEHPFRNLVHFYSENGSLLFNFFLCRLNQQELWNQVKVKCLLLIHWTLSLAILKQVVMLWTPMRVCEQGEFQELNAEPSENIKHDNGPNLPEPLLIILNLSTQSAKNQMIGDALSNYNYQFPPTFVSITSYIFCKK